MVKTPSWLRQRHRTWAPARTPERRSMAEVVWCLDNSRKARPMAKPNYQFEKRQREQQKSQKKAEKAQRKALGAPTAPTPVASTPQDEPLPE